MCYSWRYFRNLKLFPLNSLQFHISASNKSFGFEYEDILSLVLSRQQLLTITSVDLQMYCLRAITATRKFRFRRRSDTSEMVGHLIFLRPQVLASSGISFESTMIHVTPNIPLLYLLCTCCEVKRSKWK